jgi:hypothetical protein
MFPIPSGFFQRLESKATRHRAVPQAGQLREDEPHPMALFAPGSEFPPHVVVDHVLGLDEVGQFGVEVVARHTLDSPLHRHLL